jgi:hypothetical protein
LSKDDIYHENVHNFALRTRPSLFPEMLAAVTLCVLLAVGYATGQFAPHEMPRTYRRPSPLYGLHELHDYTVNVDNDRNFFHKAEINGLLFEYNVTMQKGIYNLNEVCYLYRIHFQSIQ